MSTPTSAKAGKQPVSQFYRKPRADVYTVLLVVALLAIILATVVLWQMMGEYENKIKGGPPLVWNPPAHAMAWIGGHADA